MPHVSTPKTGQLGIRLPVTLGSSRVDVDVKYKIRMSKKMNSFKEFIP